MVLGVTVWYSTCRFWRGQVSVLGLIDKHDNVMGIGGGAVGLMLSKYVGHRRMIRSFFWRQAASSIVLTPPCPGSGAIKCVVLYKVLETDVVAG